MNALVKKEARLLLPNCAIGVAAALTVWLLPVRSNLGSPLAVFFSETPVLLACGMMLGLALDSFGREFSGGTFGGLLSQPAPRGLIWRTKAGLLAAAMTVVGTTLWLSFKLHFGAAEAPLIAGCLAAAVYSGGLWSVLLLRQASIALWVTLLAPVALLTALDYLAPVSGRFLSAYSRAPELRATLHYLDSQTQPLIVAALLLYSAAGYWWARRLFLRAEDTAWTGGAVALPSPRALAKVTSRTRNRRAWRPQAALLARELMLHQSQWMIAGALAAAHLAMIALRSGHRFANDPVTTYLLDRFWMLWIVLPVLLGCAAVAEERNLGALEAELCLPVNRRAQFEIKFLVMLGLSLFFGMGMPMLLEGTSILPRLEASGWAGFSDPNHNVVTIPGNLFLQFVSGVPIWLPRAALLVLCAGLATLSFYASTLSRGTFQALGPAALAFLTTALLISEGMLPEHVVGYRLWRGPLVYLIAAPSMILALVAASFRNYQRVAVNAKLVRGNLFALGLSLGFVIAATTAVYHRAWEWVMPEAAHGAALVGVQTGADMSLGGGLAGRLSDGRVWTSVPSAPPQGWSQMLSLVGGSPYPGWFVGRSQFLEGTNWTSVAKEGPYTAAVQNDGSLWVSRKEHWSAQENAWWGSSELQSKTKMEKYGYDRDWSRVVAFPQQGIEFLLLKRDGTLWGLEKKIETRRTGPARLAPFVLKNVGFGDDWAEIISTEGGPLCRRADGSLWRPSSSVGFLAALANQTKTKIRGWAEFWKPGLGRSVVGLGEDGVLRIWLWTGPKNPLFEAKENRLGNGTNWVTVAGGNCGVVAIKSDGSLWRWTLDGNKLNSLPKRLGSHTDWIGVRAGWDGALSLAADGSVWFWPTPSDRQPDQNESPFSIFTPRPHDQGLAGRQVWSLLALSRRPARVGNIFAGNK